MINPTNYDKPLTIMINPYRLWQTPPILTNTINYDKPLPIMTNFTNFDKHYQLWQTLQMMSDDYSTTEDDSRTSDDDSSTTDDDYSTTDDDCHFDNN